MQTLQTYPPFANSNDINEIVEAVRERMVQTL